MKYITTVARLLLMFIMVPLIPIIKLLGGAVIVLITIISFILQYIGLSFSPSNKPAVVKAGGGKINGDIHGGHVVAIMFMLLTFMLMDNLNKTSEFTQMDEKPSRKLINNTGKKGALYTKKGAHYTFTSDCMFQDTTVFDNATEDDDGVLVDAKVGISYGTARMFYLTLQVDGYPELKSSKRVIYPFLRNIGSEDHLVMASYIEGVDTIDNLEIRYDFNMADKGGGLAVEIWELRGPIKLRVGKYSMYDIIGD